jgi:predicted 2-oxoglutarate/Fe(II)-dependent dioxygenase YbiX
LTRSSDIEADRCAAEAGADMTPKCAIRWKSAPAMAATVPLPLNILTVPEVLSPAECSDHIARSENIGYEPAPIVTVRGPRRDENFRNNDRVTVDDAGLGASIWPRIRDHIPAFLDSREVIGLNERFRYYRYRPGQKFALHRDGAFRRDNGEESKLTCILYLNDDFTGGETAVKDRVVAPRQGMALIFRHEFLHEGRPVLDGAKYVLRTDVMYGDASGQPRIRPIRS